MSVLLSCVTLSAAPKKVAVYVTGDISHENRSTVSSAVLARMSGNKDFEAYERNDKFVDVLDKEQDYQVSGEVPEKEIRAVGARCGVDYVIAVSVEISHDRKVNMSGKLIELESAKIEKTVSLTREYTDSSVLASLAKNVTYRLTNRNSK